MFFDSTPNFLYPDFFEAGKFKLSKNLFRRVRARDSINSIFSSSTKYTIKSGQTPDQIAYELLGDTEHYWTILLINNITDTQTQWPYDDYELDKIIEDKYGTLADKVRHWETIEVKNSSGVTIVKEGLTVDSDFEVNYYDWMIESSEEKKGITTPISNYDYEMKIENDKRNIFLLKSRYINVVKDDLEEIMTYKEGSTEYINETLKRAENIRLYS